MKERRGSELWGETDGLANAIYRFEPGDLVIPVAVKESDFLGVVKEVCPKINKIMVLWGGGSLKQHDPDEIILHPHQDPIVRSRMGCSRRGSLVVADEAIPHGDQFVGNPDTHGINEPRGGGFSIMQDLQRDLHKEMKHESLNTGPRVAGSRRGTASFFIAEGGVTADASLKSRRAMYWGAPDRVYRLTKEEQENGSALCPKCQKEMALEPFTKSEKLYTCDCGFKVPTSKTTTTRITIDVDKSTGEVDVDVTTAKGKKSRRGRL